MKLHTNHSNIERGGVQAESTFTIKTNALSFSILSSGLYTDPKMAIVRELSCNAYDAHVAAGNEKTPFEIHLPNDLEPFLSIKDYGIGLSDEDIQGGSVPVMKEDESGEMVQSTDENGNLLFNRTGGLYTTYFDSTKTNSNDFIGALGLGSKSPFSYSDAFEVISRHQGIKSTYAIFLNEEGIPTVARMGVINTDEHSGLEIKIAIKSEDFYTFKTKTATALKYFPVKPKITGTLNFEFDALPKFKIEAENWLLSSSDRYNTFSLIAVQGNVAYRVDSNQFRDEVDDALFDFINRSHIVAFFAIGDLEVSANREEIRYDKRSVAAIVSRLEMIRDEFTQQIEKKIEKINTKYWYACIELNQLSRELFNKENALRSFVKVDKIKNKNLKRYIEDNGKVGYKRILGYDLARYTINGYYAKTTKLKRSQVSSTFEPNAGTLIVFNDVKKGGINRLRNYIEENNYVEAVVIVKRDEVLHLLDDNSEPVKYEGYDSEFTRLTAELGAPDIHKLSEITEEPEKVPAFRDLPFYGYGGMHNSRGSYYAADKIKWEKTTYNIEDGGLYIPLKYGSTPCVVNSKEDLVSLGYDADGTVEAISFLISAYNDIYGTDYSIHTVLGLPTTTFNKAKKMDKWVNLFEFGKEILPDYMNVITFHTRKMKTSNVLCAKDMLDHNEFVNNVKALDNASTFRQVIMPLIEGSEKHSKDVMSKIKTITSLHNKLFNDHDVDDSPFYDEDAFKKYPMLTLVEELSYNTNWSTLFDYIKLIDRS